MLAVAAVETVAAVWVVTLAASAALISLDAASAGRTETNSILSSPSSLIIVECTVIGL
jgi:hypothetical protein